MTALNKQALREAAQEEIMLRSVSDTSDAWQDEASPEAVLAMLDELEAAEKRIAETIEYYRNRIARPKARSISLTLPPRKTLDDYIDEEFDRSDLAAIYNACRLECEEKFKSACRAAGIGVKGE